MLFDPKSRYAKLEPYEVVDRRGRKVKVVPVPETPGQTALGTHLVRQGQRMDHLAKGYLDDAAGFWRICELNDVMLPDALAEQREIEIPRKVR